eukprot:TRINITY_DN5599_c0_g1_i6.p1 TRINITY_DN5599_c0_g1~~TRINITY_DN5599_c0_g1_i6.p1  ORF type:complete len:669 (+),score=115.00 TRINITY_DN5599_c0_g1_i6:83-2089(+)
MVSVFFTLMAVAVCAATSSYTAQSSGVCLHGCVGSRKEDASIRPAKGATMLQTRLGTVNEQNVGTVRGTEITARKSDLSLAGGSGNDRRPLMGTELAKTPAPTPSPNGLPGRQSSHGLIGSFHISLAQQAEHELVNIRTSVGRFCNTLVGQSAYALRSPVFMLMMGVLIGAVTVTVIMQLCPLLGTRSNVPFATRGVDLHEQSASTLTTALQSTHDVSSGDVGAKAVSSAVEVDATAPPPPRNTLWSSLTPLNFFASQPVSESGSTKGDQPFPEPEPPASTKRSNGVDEPASDTSRSLVEPLGLPIVGRAETVPRHSVPRLPLESLNFGSISAEGEGGLADQHTSLPSVPLVTDTDESIGMFNGVQPLDSTPSLCDYASNPRRATWEFVATDPLPSSARRDSEGVLKPPVVPPAEDCSVAASVVRASVALIATQSPRSYAKGATAIVFREWHAAVFRQRQDEYDDKRRHADHAVSTAVARASIQAAVSPPRTENCAIASLVLRSSFETTALSPRTQDRVVATAVLRTSLQGAALSPHTEDRAVSAAVLRNSVQAAALSPRTDDREVPQCCGNRCRQAASVLRKSLQAAALSPRTEDRAVSAALLRNSVQAAALSPRSEDREVAASGSSVVAAIGRPRGRGLSAAEIVAGSCLVVTYGRSSGVADLDML